MNYFRWNNPATRDITITIMHSIFSSSMERSWKSRSASLKNELIASRLLSREFTALSRSCRHHRSGKQTAHQFRDWKCYLERLRLIARLVPTRSRNVDIIYRFIRAVSSIRIRCKNQSLWK